MSVSTNVKALAGVFIAGLTVMTLTIGSAFAQDTDQPAPTGQSGCSCCRNMQQMGT
jgi:hypothetical protein